MSGLMAKLPEVAACQTVEVMAFFQFDIQNGREQYKAALEQAELNMTIRMLTKNEFNKWFVERIKKEFKKMEEEEKAAGDEDE